MNEPLLSVRDFSVVYDVNPPVEAVSHVTLELQRGEVLGLAGESGCGKTTLAYGVQRLLKAPAVITSGSVVFHDASGDDVDLGALDAEQMRRFRWDKVSMVFQGAMNALNPVAQIGAQLEDVFEVHRPRMSARQRRAEVAELLEIVKVGAQRARSFPHEILEAARIDGLNEVSIFARIFMPTMRSTYAAAAVITFMTAWNNFLWPKVILLDNAYQTMPMLISNLTAGYVTNYGVLMLAVLLASLPTMVIFLVLQRSFAEGITGAIK